MSGAFLGSSGGGDACCIGGGCNTGDGEGAALNASSGIGGTCLESVRCMSRSIIGDTGSRGLNMVEPAVIETVLIGV